MSEVEVLKEVKVWNFQNDIESRLVGVFSSETKLLEVLKPYNISKDDFKYNDIIGYDEYDKPLSYILEDDYDTTTYVIWETYTLDVSLWS